MLLLVASSKTNHSSKKKSHRLVAVQHLGLLAGGETVGFN